MNTSTSVNVQYQYAGGSANTIRPTAVVYPNGRVLKLNYGTSGGMDDALSRISALIDSDGVTHLADYTRLGAASMVQVGYAQPGINYSLINGSGADPYTGLDQFNRVVDCRWYATGSNTDVARIEHGYNLASDRLWRRDTVAESQSVWQDELYNYDGLYRLSEMQRGQLNSSSNGIVSGTLNFGQAWGLDATGNWGQFWEDDSGTSWNLQQTRTASLFNEITGITGGGWVAPAYDAAGNMTTMPQPAAPTSGYTATYDAWNRLMSLWSAGSGVANYAYDGTNRRVTKLASGTTRHYYYSSRWQILEERLGGSTSYDRQFIWGLRYIDDLVLRDSPDFTPNRLFALQDPNWNTIAICDPTGTIQERYRYSAYGHPMFLTAAFGSRSSSSYDWEMLYAGYGWDVESGLLCVRWRDLHWVLGVWASRDPRGFRAGDVNLYQYVGARAVGALDPSGLGPCCKVAYMSVRQCGCGFWSYETFDGKQDRKMTKYGYKFSVNARFVPQPGCCGCYCCEYRQYIEGAGIEYRQRAGDEQTPGQLLMAPKPGLNEDCTAKPNPLLPGTTVEFCYGHRISPIGNVDSDDYSPDWTKGCTYSGWDIPGIGWADNQLPNQLAANGLQMQVRIRLKFTLQIVDRCVQGPPEVLLSQTVNVNCLSPWFPPVGGGA